MSMNNLKTQKVLRAFSFSFLILYNYQLSFFSHFSFHLSALYSPFSQEWCLSLRLCAPAMSTLTPCCTWTWARTPGSSRGRMHRSESTSHLETQIHAAPFILHFFSLIRCFSSSQPVRRTFISSCLNPTAWSTWICRAQTAVLTQWVFNGWVWSNVCLWDATWYQLKSGRIGNIFWMALANICLLLNVQRACDDKLKVSAAVFYNWDFFNETKINTKKQHCHHYLRIPNACAI